ncbi:hypothetical protein [Variovorax guangxiensis]|uniref:hypothetical protein n=1 Tax=Variovorax guangxiensis TaxID=1775474 RepID=UPI0028613210|nr:hypothetical protein [Variovorax guangxiensis]MDR6861407.1 type 1 glutamine amidotransferase [Variovorax guangxiensis]
MTFPVKVTRPEEPLLQGIGDFEVPDELYCVEDVTKDLDVLLHARWGGEGFDGTRFEEADRPLLYRRAVGEGGVLCSATPTDRTTSLRTCPISPTPAAPGTSPCSRTW